MSSKPDITPKTETTDKTATAGELLKTVGRLVAYRWPWKLLSIFLAVLLWGGLISQNTSLTREKNFQDVAINIINKDALQREGLIVVSGLEDLQPIRMRVDVPQRVYDTVTPSNYNVRVDLSRITDTGTQKLPVIYTSNTTYGNVTWLSVSEITVEVDNYITRRRIPVQLNETGTIPAGFFSTTPSVDPAMVNISGPRSIIQNVVRCVATYNNSLLSPAARTQFNAVPFKLYDNNDNAITSNLVEVTSESILLDSLLVEQTLYRLQPIAINRSGITTGQPAEGYVVTDIKIDPAMLNVAGSNELMETLTLLDVDAPIDISGASDTLIRSVKVKRPEEAYHMSANAVYVTITIESAAAGDTFVE